MKFLDSAGLKVVLNRIKSTFATKAELSAVEKRIGGGGTKIEECWILVVDKYNKSNYFKIKIVETSSVTHFYIMIDCSYSGQTITKPDFIKCVCEYELNNLIYKDSKSYDKVSLILKINQNGLIFKKEYTDTIGFRKVDDNASWIYLGGVPTSEIRK